VTLGEQSSKLAYQQAIKNIRKQASLPGFRKGHLPEALVLQHFGKAVEQEYRQTSAEFSFRELHKNRPNEVHLLDNKSVKTTLVKVDPTECVFRFDVQCHPAAPAVLIKELSFTRPSLPSSIEADELEKVLKETKHAYSTFEPAEPRAVVLGDTISLTLHQLAPVEGEESFTEPKLLSEKMEWSVPANEEDLSPFDAWLLALVKGKKPGKVVEAPFTADSATPALPIRVKIEGQLLEKEPSDEELCAKTHTSSLAELRENLSKRLLDTKCRQAQFETKNKLAQALLEKYSFELPHTLVEKFRRSAIARQIAFYNGRGMAHADLRAKEEGIQQQATKETEERLRLFYLAKRHLQENSPALLTVTKQELEQAAFMDSLGPEGSKILYKGISEEDMVDTLMIAQITDRFLTLLSQPLKTV